MDKRIAEWTKKDGSEKQNKTDAEVPSDTSAAKIEGLDDKKDDRTSEN